MSPENEQSLRAKYPRLFGRASVAPKSALAKQGFAVGDGWLGVLDALAAEIEQSCIASGRSFPVFLQVKEKFGVLRVYVDGADEAIDGAIARAERSAARTCEVCGEPGRTHQIAGVRTRCPNHISEPL